MNHLICKNHVKILLMILNIIIFNLKKFYLKDILLANKFKSKIRVYF